MEDRSWDKHLKEWKRQWMNEEGTLKKLMSGNYQDLNRERVH